jgi:uncharacterized protein YbcI
MKKNMLTTADTEALHNYLQEIEEINKNEPKNVSSEIWENWNKERLQIESKYHSTIIKALRCALHNIGTEEQKIIDLIKEIVGDNVSDIMSEQVRAALPQLASIIPQKHLIPNNKLANSLTKDIIGAGLIELDVGRKKDDILTRCILSYEGDNVKLTSRRSFTEYDRQVADAVTSLYEYGDKSHIITAATVYRAMVHATETETPSPQQIEAVTQSLDKLRFVRVQIDCTEELMRRNIDLNGSQITAGKIDTYLLTLDKMEVIAGGQKVVAYKVIKTPILYEYSRLTGQVITVPAALLDIRDKTGAKIPNTERRIAIKGYLMRRISIMKGQNSKNQSCHILYDSLYNEVCSTEPTQKEKRLIRDYIPCVLEYWKSEKFIKDYEELTHGKKKIGIEIKI